MADFFFFPHVSWNLKAWTQAHIHTSHKVGVFGPSKTFQSADTQVEQTLKECTVFLFIWIYNSRLKATVT